MCYKLQICLLEPIDSLLVTTGFFQKNLEMVVKKTNSSEIIFGAKICRTVWQFLMTNMTPITH
jgi:hypothetical protein